MFLSTSLSSLDLYDTSNLPSGWRFWLLENATAFVVRAVGESDTLRNGGLFRLRRLHEKFHRAYFLNGPGEVQGAHISGNGKQVHGGGIRCLPVARLLRLP